MLHGNLFTKKCLSPVVILLLVCFSALRMFMLVVLCVVFSARRVLEVLVVARALPLHSGFFLSPKVDTEHAFRGKQGQTLVAGCVGFYLTRTHSICQVMVVQVRRRTLFGSHSNEARHDQHTLQLSKRRKRQCAIYSSIFKFHTVSVRMFTQRSVNKQA